MPGRGPHPSQTAAIALGRSRPLPTAIGLGTAALTSRYGAPGSQRVAPGIAAAATTIELAIELGIGFIDTAPAYDEAETIVGAVCEGASCLIATKLAIPNHGWNDLEPTAVADFVNRSAENSLVALRRDRIDLLQVHNADIELIARGDVPAALEQLRGDGMVGACGATVYGEENALAAIACPVFDAVQIAYSALDRRPERVIVPAAAGNDTILISRSILLRGVLSTAGRSLTGEFRPLGDSADAFRSAIGATWEQLPGAAVAFAVTRPGISRTLLGPRDADELRSLLDGSTQFLESASELQGDWDAALPPELLDPSLWPETG